MQTGEAPVTGERIFRTQAAQSFVPGSSSIHSSWRTLPNPPGRDASGAPIRTLRYRADLAEQHGRRSFRATYEYRRPLGTPRWSPDGGWIAFDTHVENHSHIFVVDSEAEIFMPSPM